MASEGLKSSNERARAEAPAHGDALWAGRGRGATALSFGGLSARQEEVRVLSLVGRGRLCHITSLPVSLTARWRLTEGCLAARWRRFGTLDLICTRHTMPSPATEV
jgi:hypothetical protein